MTSFGSDHDELDRSVTRLSDVTNRWERMLVQFDPRSGEPNGPWEKKYCSIIREKSERVSCTIFGT